LPSSRVFQSTPPRGGRRPRVRRGGSGRGVSIHAPAWGATMRSGPRPVRVASFNPRPRVGGDATSANGVMVVISVSIHAPAWGATGGRQADGPGQAVSIHAPAWGATPPL